MQAEQATEAAHSLAKSLMWGLLALAVALSVGIAFIVTRRITSQLGGEPEHSVQLVQRIAGGDLSQDLALQAGDTQSLMAHQQQMQSRLRSLLKDISATVDSTESAAQSLAGSSQQVAGASRATSDSATSMAAVVEEMSVSISQVADNARDALKTANHAAKLSDSGGSVIEQATIEINRIADTVRRTSEAMSLLDDSPSRISTVVQVIKEVADQTNPLALNAAIEAARAGEQGRGFAVVADEVRKLAEATGKATNEINGDGPADPARDAQLCWTSTADRGAAGRSWCRTGRIGGRGDAQHPQQCRPGGRRGQHIGSAIEEQLIASQQIAQRVEQAQASEENGACQGRRDRQRGRAHSANWRWPAIPSRSSEPEPPPGEAEAWATATRPAARSAPSTTASYRSTPRPRKPGEHRRNATSSLKRLTASKCRHRDHPRAVADQARRGAGQ